jgi:hypothetical protein
MGQHSARAYRTPRPVVALTLALVPVTAAFMIVMALRSPDTAVSDRAATPCSTILRVVTATSFAPVLQALGPTLNQNEDCVRLEVSVADGRTAAARVVELDAHVWVPDDAAWAGATPVATLAPPETQAVVAVSPIYLVTDPATAQRVTAAGGSWLGLAGLATADTGVRLVVREPAGSGDGLVAAGALGEAVWLDAGMNASAKALGLALPHTRTARATALPQTAGEVGLVPEYALQSALESTDRELTVLAPTDHTAQLRFTWLPTADAVREPALAAAMTRTLATLRGPQADGPLASAGLRRPDGPPSVATAGLPPASAPPFEVLAPHHVEHVFASWYPADRRTDLLVGIDVSGSMANSVGGRPLIDLVRDGCGQLGALLPDDAQLSVWEFGSQLDPPRDHRVLLPRAPLSAAHRQALTGVLATMSAKPTGTGLYDTLLAAYASARDNYRPGVPNQVLVFTDGRNGDDPGSITLEQLSSGLAAARDSTRPVRLTVVTFGPEPEAELLATALEPVDGHVEPLTTADEVGAVFIHVAAGGLHH